MYASRFNKFDKLIIYLKICIIKCWLNPNETPLPSIPPMVVLKEIVLFESNHEKVQVFYSKSLHTSLVPEIPVNRKEIFIIKNDVK